MAIDGILDKNTYLCTINSVKIHLYHQLNQIITKQQQ